MRPESSRCQLSNDTPANITTVKTLLVIYDCRTGHFYYQHGCDDLFTKPFTSFVVFCDVELQRNYLHRRQTDVRKCRPLIHYIVSNTNTKYVNLFIYANVVICIMCNIYHFSGSTYRNTSLIWQKLWILLSTPAFNVLLDCYNTLKNYSVAYCKYCVLDTLLRVYTMYW